MISFLFNAHTFVPLIKSLFSVTLFCSFPSHASTLFLASDSPPCSHSLSLSLSSTRPFSTLFISFARSIGNSLLFLPPSDELTLLSFTLFPSQSLSLSLERLYYIYSTLSLVPIRQTFLSPPVTLRLARSRLFIDSVVSLRQWLWPSLSLDIIVVLALAHSRSHPLSSLMDFLSLSSLGPRVCLSSSSSSATAAPRNDNTRARSCVHGASVWTGNLRIAGLTEKEEGSPRAPDRFLWCFEILYARCARKLTVCTHTDIFIRSTRPEFRISPFSRPFSDFVFASARLEINNFTGKSLFRSDKFFHRRFLFTF